MKVLKPVLTVALILLGLLLCETAWARPGGHSGGGHGYSGGHVHGQWHGGGAPVYPRHYHGHGGYWRGGVFVAAPLFWYGDPFYDPFYRRYYYYRSVWWYCDAPSGYYPQVMECSVPWRIVYPPPG